MAQHTSSAALYAQAATSGLDLENEIGDWGMVVGGALGLVVVLVIAVAVLKRYLFICGPHEILVFSGRKHKLPDGSVSNYKIIHGGRGFRVPFLELVGRMDMRLFPVEVVVSNAYSRGGIPLTVRAIANVKLSSNRLTLRNAVERFLDYDPSQIAVAAQQTLEGVLREVISQLTPEEVNEDRLKFADGLIENARDDFDKLGLELDVLKVQHVSDDQDYLTNLGRARVAGMLRDAKNAENSAKQAITEAKAQAQEDAQTATKQAETHVVEARNLAAAETADLDANAKEAENQAGMAVNTARVTAQQELETLRAELEKIRLHNDVVQPALAKRKARELQARGEAAPTIENGKAAAEALRVVAEQWALAGEAGRDVYVLQQLQQLAQAAVDRVSASDVGSIKLVGSDDEAYGAVLASHPAAVGRVLREIGTALGIDIGRIMNRTDGPMAQLQSESPSMLPAAGSPAQLSAPVAGHHSVPATGPTQFGSSFPGQEGGE